MERPPSANKKDSMSDNANYTYGEVPVTANVQSSQRATPEQLVQLAKGIWRSVETSGISKDDEAGNDVMLSRIQSENKDFNQSFPLVLRWMVQMRQFNSKAFEKYLLKHASAKLDTREGFLELQAEYLVLLYKETHRHADEVFVRRYRQSLVQQLLEEDKSFMEMQKQVETDLASQSVTVDLDRRRRLYEFLLAQKVAREKVAVSVPTSGSEDAVSDSTNVEKTD